VEGMEAEGRGNSSAAAELFHRAWDMSTNDFERCIAAHYVARHQPTANHALDWNQTAMDCAGRAPDDSVAAFMPSLCLNLGKSLEDLGNTADARRLYRRASDMLDRLPAGGYRDIVQDGINRALQRVDDFGAAS